METVRCWIPRDSAEQRRSFQIVRMFSHRSQMESGYAVESNTLRAKSFALESLVWKSY